MMKWKWFIQLSLLEVFIQLTQPHGGPILFEESQISVIKPHPPQCRGNTVVVTAGGTYCVLETPEQIKTLMENARKGQ